ncbi:MAG: hypothetical protein NDI61_14010 [Bdellovibrionaceae bacterium]|nr:hypothetical protein [Pseudobdellovibrionaceae bacterium]
MGTHADFSLNVSGGGIMNPSKFSFKKGRTMIARFILTLALGLLLPLSSNAMDARADVLETEFQRLYEYVQNLPHDGMVGGFMKYKKVQNHLILWELAYNVHGDDVIRLFNEHKDGTDSFAVSYYRSKSIIPGRTVIRRFVGPSVIGWRNDTMDVLSGEYLGTQGFPVPRMTAEDKKLLQRWKVRLLK